MSKLEELNKLLEENKEIQKRLWKLVAIPEYNRIKKKEE